MKSQTSFCSRTLIKKDLQRFWPIWVILIAVMLTGFVMTTLFGAQQLYSRTDYSLQENLASIIQSINSCMTNGFMLFTIGAASIITAVSVFGYMNRTCSAYMLHSLLVKRETHCMSHIISGFVMMGIPVTLTWLALFVINLCYGAGMSAAIAEYYLESMFMVCFYYSLAAFVTLLCGSGILSAIVYVVLNVGVLAAYWLLKCIHSIISYAGSFDIDMAIRGGWIQYLTPFLNMYRILRSDHNWNYYNFYNKSSAEIDNYLSNITAFSGATLGKMALFLLPALALILLSILLYKKRPLEKTGKLLVFKWSVPIFRFVFVLFTSLMFTCVIYLISGGLLTYYLSYRGLLIVFEISAAIGVVIFSIVCDMILQRTFKIWSSISWSQILITAAIVVLLILGQTNNYRYPLITDTNEIDSIRLTENNGGQLFIYDDEEDILSISKLEELMTDACAEDMNKLTVDEVSSGNHYEMQVLFKDGSTHMQYYSLSADREAELLKELMTFINDPDRALRSMPLFNIDRDVINSIEVYNYSEIIDCDEYSIIFETEEEIDEIIETIRKDISDKNMRIAWFYNNNPVSDVTTEEVSTDESYTSAGTITVYYDHNLIPDDIYTDIYYNYRFNFDENCTNIIKTVNEKCKK